MMHSVVPGELNGSKDAAYFRRRADRTRELSELMLQVDVRKTLLDLARDYDELAEDLANGVKYVRHPELMPRADVLRRFETFLLERSGRAGRTVRQY
jgi:hypothetical protein